MNIARVLIVICKVLYKLPGWIDAYQNRNSCKTINAIEKEKEKDRAA
ncbi:hypothetical protein [Halobacteriovorax sp. JY17]|nr:hypothetical protein [Halobacteriovorax sp. JY17]